MMASAFLFQHLLQLLVSPDHPVAPMPLGVVQLRVRILQVEPIAVLHRRKDGDAAHADGDPLGHGRGVGDM